MLEWTQAPAVRVGASNPEDPDGQAGQKGDPSDGEDGEDWASWLWLPAFLRAHAEAVLCRSKG